jgi:transposase
MMHRCPLVFDLLLSLWLLFFPFQVTPQIFAEHNHRQFLKFCGLNISTLQSGKSRDLSHISKYGNARLRTVLWMAAQSAVRMRENSFRREFDNYVRANPLNADLRRKGYTAVTAKLARVVFGLINSS